MINPIPTPGTIWRHYNGNAYTVLCITNTAETNGNPDKYPPQVVHIGPNGNIWSRALSDWHRSMTPVAV